MKKIFLTLILVFIFSISNTFSQVDVSPNSSKLKLALDKLNVLGSVLYVAAHPDDENNTLLAYLTKGKHIRTAYLSLTRGDGGQNLIGTEQGDLLGVLRTQELLSARRIDGAQQFFSRSIDFGYSKSAKETFQFWGRNKILSDIVWIIRKFRPDVIITRFPGTGEGGHGNHTASEILAAEAFKISGDSTKFPEQLKYVKPWRAKRIIWNAWLPILKKRGSDLSKIFNIDVGVYNPILGESYTEIAAQARSMHKTQGFGSSPRLGKHIEYFLPIDGQPIKHSLFDEIDISWNRIPGSENIKKNLELADKRFDPSHPDKIIPLLLNAYSSMNKLPDNYWIKIKKKELVKVIANCAGIHIDADASDYSAVPGQSVSINSSIINRSDFPITLKAVKVSYQKKEQILNDKLLNEKLYRISSVVNLPEDLPYSQPYWLRYKHGLGDYVVKNQQLIGQPENKPPLNVKFILEADSQELTLKIPVKYKWNDPVKGEEFRPFIIVPPVAINIENKNYVFPSDSTRHINISLISNIDSASGTLEFHCPSEWEIIPAEKSFFIPKKGNVVNLQLNVVPPAKSSDVTLNAEAIIGNKKVNCGMITINYPHITEQTVFPPAETKLIRLDTKKVINNIGYIMGPGDKVPVYLRELGYNVTMINNKDIENGNLSKYDAIITGIRLYNTDNKISFEQSKLLNYVKNGGTLVIQYNKNFGLVTKNIGPYPFHISRKRVTDETAKVKFLKPNSPLLNFPNKITQNDFKGWVQERGVYFPDTWSPKYQTIIACHDPGEKPLQGGILYTKYGKGVFIYTGYDWFRELPDGVPGAYRIFVNLISAGKAPI